MWAERNSLLVKLTITVLAWFQHNHLQKLNLFKVFFIVRTMNLGNIKCFRILLNKQEISIAFSDIFRALLKKNPLC